MILRYPMRDPQIDIRYVSEYEMRAVGTHSSESEIDKGCISDFLDQISWTNHSIQHL